MGFLRNYVNWWNQTRESKSYCNKSSEDIRQMMARYRNWKKSKFSENTVIDIINQARYKQGKQLISSEPKTAPDGWEIVADDRWENGKYKPGYIAPFTDEQRADRKAKSDVAFEMLFEQIEAGAEERKRRIATVLNLNLDHLPRMCGMMMLDTDPNASAEEKARINDYNREVVELFGGDAFKQNLQKRKEAYKDANPDMTDEQAEQVLRARRAQLFMNYIHEAGPVEDDPEAMIDPDLPVDKLKKNIKKVLDWNNAIQEIENFIKLIPGSCTLSVEEMEELRRLTLSQASIGAAFNKINMMANPTFEYLDSSWLADDNVRDLFTNTVFPDRKNWSDVSNNDAECLNEEEKAYFSGFEPLSGNFDPVEDFVQDASFVAIFRKSSSLNKALREYGFTSEPTQFVRYVEPELKPGNGIMNGDDQSIPFNVDVFAIERNGRYGVFRKTEDNGYEAATPELLFNHSTKTMLASLTADMNTADPVGHRGSRQFREMREAFEEISQNNFDWFTNLEPGANHEVMEKYLNNLIRKAEAYTATKTASLKYVEDRRKNAKKQGREYNLTTRETWDEQRVAMAEKLKSFAQIKRQELNLVKKTHDTMKQYEHLSEERRLEQINSYDQSYLAKKREDEPKEWLYNKIKDTYLSEYSDIPKRIKVQLKAANKVFNNNSLESMITYKQDDFLAMVGRMIAAEQIMMENTLMRNMPGGRLRSFYAHAKKDFFIQLGKDALKAAGSFADEMDGYYNFDKTFVAQEKMSIDDEQPLEAPEEVSVDVAAEQELSAEYIKMQATQFNPKAIAAALLNRSYAKLKVDGVEMQLRGQYLNTINPMRSSQLDEYECALKDFVKTNITNYYSDNLIDGNVAVFPNTGKLGIDEARHLLSSCVISDMIQMERTSRGKQAGPSPLEAILANDAEGIRALREKIEQDTTFDSILIDNTLDDANIPYANLLAVLTKGELRQCADELKQKLNEFIQLQAERARKAINRKNIERKYAARNNQDAISEEDELKYEAEQAEKEQDEVEEQPIVENNMLHKKVPQNDAKLAEDAHDIVDGILGEIHEEARKAANRKDIEQFYTAFNDRDAISEEDELKYERREQIIDWIIADTVDLSNDIGRFPSKKEMEDVGLDPQLMVFDNKKLREEFLDAERPGWKEPYAEKLALREKMIDWLANGCPEDERYSQEQFKEVNFDTTLLTNEKKRSWFLNKNRPGWNKPKQNVEQNVNKNIINEAPEPKQISEKELREKMESGTATYDEFKQVYMAKATALANKLNKANVDKRAKPVIVGSLQQLINNVNRAESPDAGFAAMYKFAEKQLPIAWHANKTYRINSAEFAAFGNDLIHVLNNRARMFKDEIEMNGLLRNGMESYNELKQTCIKQAEELQKKLVPNTKGDTWANLFAERGVRSLNTLLTDLDEAKTVQQGYKVMMHFVKKAEGTLATDKKENHPVDREYKVFSEALNNKLQNIATADRSVFNRAATETFQNDKVASVKRVEALIAGMKNHNESTSMAYNRLVSSLEQYKKVCEDVKLPNRSSIAKWREALEQAQKTLASAEYTGDFLPDVRSFLTDQVNYLNTATGIDPWSRIQRKQHAPQKKPAKLPDAKSLTKVFYEKSDMLIDLAFAEKNKATEAIDAKLSKLLEKSTKARVYEVCIQNYSEIMKNGVLPSEKMKSLAVYATMKALLLNEQCEPHVPGTKGKITELIGDTKKGVELLEKMVRTNAKFQTKFASLNNRGMYNFIVNAEYRTLAQTMAHDLYKNLYDARHPQKQARTNPANKPRTNEKGSIING